MKKHRKAVIGPKLLKDSILAVAQESQDSNYKGRGGGTTYDELVQRMCDVWSKIPDVAPEDVKAEIKRLRDTRQIEEQDGKIVLGHPKFEHGITVTDKANETAWKIWDNLSRRHGFRELMNNTKHDLDQEIRNAIAVIIDEAYRKNRRKTVKKAAKKSCKNMRRSKT
jgi:hypothetical protein